MSKEHGLVFYVDGSTRPTNPGHSGFGCHGYLFEKGPVKRGSGCPTHIVTQSGYVLKSEELDSEAFTEVTPIKYFDAFGSIDEMCTNNVAEIHAMNFCLNLALEHEVGSVTVYTDSEYVRRSIDEWSAQWQKMNWIKRDGTPVSNADLLKGMIDKVNTLKEKGIELIIHWVKGHSGILGNHKADKLALMGSGYSIAGKPRVENKISENTGYWKKVTEKPQLFGLKSLIFGTQNSIPAGTYHLVNASKEEDIIGDKSASSSYQVVKLHKPEQIIETAKEWHTQMCEGINTTMLLRLEKLYKPEVYEDAIDYPEVTFIRVSPHNFDCMYLDKSPISKELRPVKLAFRAITMLSFLEIMMENFLSGSQNIQSIDLTSTLYESAEKGKKMVTKLKSQYGSAEQYLKVELDIKGKKIAKKLEFGIDMLPRNNLKNMEGMNTQVHLILWSSGEHCTQYATITQNDEGVCITCAPNSNSIYC